MIVSRNEGTRMREEAVEGEKFFSRDISESKNDKI